MPKSKTQSLNPTILQAALQGLEIQRNTLDEQIEEVRALLGHRAPGRSARANESDSEQQAQPHRSRLSAAARKRISAAQRKRWAKVRSDQRSKEKSKTKKAVKKSAI
jgi:peptidoglycan hydrolase CwlO-like protein